MTVSAISMTGPEYAYAVGVVLCAAFVLNVWRQHRRRHGLPLPPGPSGLPLIGNTLDLNPVHPWLSYKQWGKRYGSLVYANLLGMDLIIINSAKVAHNLFDRRSTVYSDRPHIPANEIFGIDFNSGLLPYGNAWRLHRRMYNTALNKSSAHQYKPVAINKARRLVQNLLDAPEDYAKHCKTFAAATIMAATYGYDVALKDDPFVTKIDLAHIPSWMPGGRYKKQAKECRALAKEVLNSPVEYVKDKMAAGTAGKSIVRDLLETEGGKVDEDGINAVAASAFLGGTEINDSTLRVFIMAMILYPEVQAETQAEIDRVVGTERLPDFGDRPNLPYVEAVLLETLRWRPVVPTALPLMTATSDVYEGVYIPKGAIVLTNIWAMGHDETWFEDPMTFVPERHLTPAGALAEGMETYAFGRRVCPGRHLADQNVWAAIVTILATMRLAKTRDNFGNEIEVKAEFTGGLASGPKPFVCSITPRHPYVESLVGTRDEHER